ncbi:MAG: choice-of-anchor B family protein [Bacteroidota bacterium]
MNRLLLYACSVLLLASWQPATAQTTADGAASAANGFSYALGVYGDQVIAAEPDMMHAPGLVYVFGPDESGTYTEQTRLQADDGEVGNGFGTALSVADDRMAITAPNADSMGAAYLFEANDGAWSQIDRLAPSDTLESFGNSVAHGGDVVLVGAPAHNDRTGEAVAFWNEDGSWTQARLASDELDLDKGASFGARVAVHENTIFVSAPNHDRGVVLAFTYDDEADAWTESDRIMHDDLTGGARFGSSLAIHDDVMLVGASRQEAGTGAVFAFTYDEDIETWAPTSTLSAFDGSSRSRFGTSLAFDGSNAWVGAPNDDSRRGAAYRYTYDDGRWTSAERVFVPEIESGYRLGATIAAGTSVAAAGLPGGSNEAGMAALLQPDGSSWTASQTLEGAPGVGLEAQTGGEVTCDDGEAGTFDCENIDLLSFLPIHEIGGERGVNANDVWGWTDPDTEREIALVGLTNTLAFVDVTDPVNPVYLGQLPMTEGARSSSWRDMKVYQNHMYVVSDNAGEHGMQVFDLTQLRDYYGTDEPNTFEPDTVYDRINSAHNVFVNEDTGYAYIVGASGGGETCGGGLHMVNLDDPASPQFEGCFADDRTGRSGTGYSHDVQCVSYEGPDERYQGREICFGANETALSVADVTDKENPEAVSVSNYPNVGYTHQGWLGEDQRYFYMNDELDVLQGLVDNTRTLIWDLRDLEDPQLVDEFFFETNSSAHNLYTKGDLMYLSNYKSGLHLMDISNREEPSVVGQFDTAPYQEGPGFTGSWSNYPYFESGTILVNSIGEGIFMLRPQQEPL